MSADPNVKLAKAILLNAACVLAAAVIEDEGAPAGAAAQLTIDPTLSNKATQNINIAGSQEVTTFYAWLLQCMNTNGTNSDGSSNAFLDPTIDAGTGTGTGLSPGLAALVQAIAKAIPAGTQISGSLLPTLQAAISQAIGGVLASTAVTSGTTATPATPPATPTPVTVPASGVLKF